MNLPMNLLSWAMLFLLALIVWLRGNTRSMRFTPTFLLMLASAALFTLPVFWSPHDGLPVALPRLLGIWGGVLIYLTLLQCPVCEKEVVALFYLLTAAALIETAISLTGIYFPDALPFPWDTLAHNYHGRAPGVFQQVNVTSSFLATGLAAALFLMADRRLRLVHPRAEKGRIIAVVFTIVLLSATLVLFHSRIGWIGGVTAMICTSLLFGSARFRYRTNRWRRALLVLLPAIGGILGATLLQGSVADSLVHESSNHQRWLTLDYTLRMIMEHPWRGWGLGMFEPAFQNYMARLPFANPSREMMQHPHNETLFIWAEGGLLALAGGLSLVAGWIVLFRRRKNLWQWAALLATLPILLHTQVEFPLYYSVPHFFALLLLMAVAEDGREVVHFHTTARLWLGALSLYGMVLSAQLFSTSVTLGKFETDRLNYPESIKALNAPWLMQMRFQRDVSLLHLARFNQNGDLEELEAFVHENGHWIRLHIEEDAYNDQINALLFLGRRSEARVLKQQAHQLMPWDRRFAS
ncbi:TPA: O-antigen ligase C-terminal domain-containing protein [Enterobacter cancerogenus]|nr:O-antigen ligase C-terminal domain-containing protein [Enterobacter cancerogenus]